MVWTLYEEWLISHPRWQDPKPVDKETVGKFLFFAPHKELQPLLPLLDQLVEKREIHQVKFTHKIFENIDPLYNKTPVMCIYADDKTKKEVKSKLESIGIPTQRLNWKSDKQTHEDWKPGGKLYKRTKGWKNK